MFKKLKDKATGAMLRRQLKKSGLPEDQQEMLVQMVQENPEFFQKIEKEVKEKKDNQGMNEQAAMMQVMREHQSELQQMMMKSQGGSK